MCGCASACQRQSGYRSVGSGRGGPRVAVASARCRSRRNLADLGGRRACLGGEHGPGSSCSGGRPRGPGRRRAVPARHEVRRRDVDDDHQPGLADGAEDRRARRDLLPDGRRTGRTHHPVRRRRPARGSGEGGAGGRRPDGLGRPEEPDLPPGLHRAARPVADQGHVRHRPGAAHRAGRRRVHRTRPRPVHGLRRPRPGAVELARQRLRRDRRPHPRRDRPGHEGLPGVRQRSRGDAARRGDVQRVPGHQRRLDRPAGRRPARRPVRDRVGRQPRADRAAAVRPARPRDPCPRLRRRREGCARGLARLAAHGLRRGGARVRRGVARLRRAPAPAARVTAHRHAARAVPGLDHGARRERRQDLPRRVRRLAELAVGVRPGRPLRSLPPGVGAGPLPDRFVARPGRRHRRRQPGARLPLRPPAEA